MDENDEVEEGLRRDVDSFRSNSTRATAERFTTDSVISERTCTMPQKNDLYCFVAPVPLIIVS